MSQAANEILLEIIHRRYQKNSTIIAANRPIEDWGKIFGDNATASAILDRFLEKIHIIKITGLSYRLRKINAKEQKLIVIKKLTKIERYTFNCPRLVHLSAP